jgi:hypothetical protein
MQRVIAGRYCTFWFTIGARTYTHAEDHLRTRLHLLVHYRRGD